MWEKWRNTNKQFKTFQSKVQLKHTKFLLTSKFTIFWRFSHKKCFLCFKQKLLHCEFKSSSKTVLVQEETQFVTKKESCFTMWLVPSYSTIVHPFPVPSLPTLSHTFPDSHTSAILRILAKVRISSTLEISSKYKLLVLDSLMKQKTFLSSVCCCFILDSKSKRKLLYKQTHLAFFSKKREMKSPEIKSSSCCTLVCWITLVATEFWTHTHYRNVKKLKVRTKSEKRNEA